MAIKNSVGPKKTRENFEYTEINDDNKKYILVEEYGQVIGKILYVKEENKRATSLESIKYLDKLDELSEYLNTCKQELKENLIN